ncbi:MAG TPA: hypothetical protein VGD81_00895, partial [Opitutaceae bacterium]
MIVQALFKVSRTTNVKLPGAKPKKVNGTRSFDQSPSKPPSLHDERIHRPDRIRRSPAEVDRRMPLDSLRP